MRVKQISPCFLTTSQFWKADGRWSVRLFHQIVSLLSFSFHKSFLCLILKLLDNTKLFFKEWPPISWLTLKSINSSLNIVNLYKEL